jgi:predicted ATP-grasp superfamily ATP-dependent carboligase
MLSIAPANSPPNLAPLLIVALSGRALARSAQRGGYKALVLDLYNDLDTRSCAIQSRQVPGSDGDFDSAALLRIAGEVAPVDSGVVAGTGFEAAPALLGKLAAGRELCGNSPDTIARMKDPSIFFPLLDALNIPHPSVSFSPPANPQRWLTKKIGGSGGTHIHPATHAAASDAGRYYQRLVHGRSASVLFLANGSEARIIGRNEQFTAGVDGSAYRYAGAVNRIELPPTIETEIDSKVNALVRASGLVGLNGLDFILAGDAYQVLEVNPRPTATIDLHDADFPDGLFHLHLQACRGRLPARMPDSHTVRAHAVLYAREALTIPAWLRFPDWCSDLPAAGTQFARRTPVCTVHACGGSVSEVKRLLAHRRAIIERAVSDSISAPSGVALRSLSVGGSA